MRAIQEVEQKFSERIQLLEQQKQIGVWSAQMEQTELFKVLQVKVNNYEDDFTTMHKQINEMKALATMGSGLTSLQPKESTQDQTNQTNSSPGMVKEIFGFWAVTRQFFEDQARDFLMLMRNPSDSQVYGYNQLDLQNTSSDYVIP